EDELELTTFQQLYIEIPKDNKDVVIKEFESVGLKCYPVGNYVKSLRTCNFCKGVEREGMSVAKEINRRIAGKPVPFTLKVAYTGIIIGCSELIISNICIMKYKYHYNLYIGGKSKEKYADVDTILKKNLTPEEKYDTLEKIITV